MQFLQHTRLAGLFFLVSIFFCTLTYAGENVNSLYLNRKSHTLYVLNAENQLVKKFTASIGRGGIAQKKSMSDYVTPTGDFEVDLILYTDPNFDMVASQNLKQFQKHQNFDLIKDQAGLKQLFENMNVLDFDGDGKADQAYGKAYIGLKGNAVTGPKLHTFHGVPYWFSIALHGTPDEKLLGGSTSGGCVHLSAQALEWLVTEKIVTLGTKVTIRDEDPKL